MDLIAKFEHARQVGENSWQCKCPAHDDGTASLSVSKVEGKWLLNCHAGCGISDVVSAMGIEMRDLFDDQQDQQPRQQIEYKYHDANGKHVYSAIRTPLPNGKKKFAQRRADGEWSMKGVQRVLYNLPAVLKSPVVFVVEGEKDVETLRGSGLVATCNVGGAGKFHQSYAKHLEGKTVYILPDNDAPGREHAKDVLEILGHGKVVELPVGPKEDVTDWFRSDGDREALERLITEADKPDQTLESAALEYVSQLSRETGQLYTTGIGALDEDLAGGIAPGELVILAARPSHGKTACGLQLLHSFAEQGLPGLFINNDMSEEMIAERTVRFISSIVAKDTWPSNKPELSEDIQRHFSDRQPVYMLTETYDVDAIISEIRRHHSEHGVQVVMVDYLQQLSMKSLGNRATSYEVVSEASKKFARLKAELGIVIIALSQLNRDIESKRERQTSDKKKSPSILLPKMSDLRESGQIEQDADVVTFCVWPFMCDQQREKSEYVFCVAKNRNRGLKNGITNCEFDPRRQRVTDLQLSNHGNYYEEFDHIQ